MKTYKVHTYDVWGNKNDGFEVNDVYPSCATIELPDDATDADIVRALKDVGVINAKCRTSSFEVDGETDYTMYVNYLPIGYPVCELRAHTPSN